MAKKSKNYYYDGYYYSESAGEVLIAVLFLCVFVLIAIGLVVLIVKGVKELFRWLNDTADKLAAEEAEKRLNGTMDDESRAGKNLNFFSRSGAGGEVMRTPRLTF